MSPGEASATAQSFDRAGSKDDGGGPTFPMFAPVAATAALPYVFSFALHAALLALAFWIAAGVHGGDEDDAATRLRGYLPATVAVESEIGAADDDGAGAPGGGKPGGSGRPNAGEAGRLGSARETAPASHARPAPRESKPSLNARELAGEEARAFGALGELSKLTISAPFGGADLAGDEPAARGAMWARTIDDASGYGSALSGTGDGGGGLRAGIGLGDLGVLGYGRGRSYGFGDGDGLGDRGRGGLHGLGTCNPPPAGCDGVMRGGHGMGSHVVGRPRLHCEPPPLDCSASVDGRLPAGTIQRIVQQSLGRFRACYERALLQNPTLKGTVTTAFVIDRTGAVAMTANAGSDLPDAAVVSCIVSAFASLSFPAPESGSVHVTYPFMLSPAD